MEIQFRTFEKQRQALQKLEDKVTTEVLYGGGARGGKSWLGCGWIFRSAMTMPGSSWLIAREELTKLKDTTLLTFGKVAKSFGLTEYYSLNNQNLIATFENGSKVFFRELKFIPSDKEFDRLGSYDLTGAFIDEAQQIAEKAISVLKGRFSVLSGEGWSTIPKCLYTCNPAKNWIYRDYVKPANEGTLASHKAFIKSLAIDNPTNTQDYLDNLLRADKITVQRLYYGNFEYDDDKRSLVGYDAICDLFKNTQVLGGNFYITADIARFGKDKTVIFVWSGWKLVGYKVLLNPKVTESAAAINELRKSYQVPVSRIVADEDGVGGGVVDIVGCKGFVNNSRALPNKEATGYLVVGSNTKLMMDEPENFDNLKSQCGFHLADQINKGLVDLSYITDIDMKEAISEELEQLKQKDIDKDGKRKLIPKDEIKEFIGRSPDYSDTILMRKYFDLTKERHFGFG